MAHARELENEVPDRPLVFMKPPSAILANNNPFYIPEFSNEIHYEGELVVRIRKNGRHVQRKFARDYFGEIAFGIDFTARDIQTQLKSKGHPWEIAKGFDNSAPLSPWIPLEGDPQNIKFSLKKNGETVQEGDTSLMIFPIVELICYISNFFKLQIGDMIFTGTPSGVGPVVIGDFLEGFIGEQNLLSCKIK